MTPHHRAGGHFSPHLDGPWVPHEDESSVFTVVVYLTSDFQGGETRFLDEETKSKSDYRYVLFCRCKCRFLASVTQSCSVESKTPMTTLLDTRLKTLVLRRYSPHTACSVLRPYSPHVCTVSLWCETCSVNLNPQPCQECMEYVLVIT